MNLDEQKNRYRALDDWFRSTQGRYVASGFIRLLARNYPKWPSSAHVLQLGWRQPMIRRQAKRTHCITPCLDDTKHLSVIASPLQLPFKRNCLDIVIAPMLFELFSSDQKAVKQSLDELDRVLSPMGHIVLWGVNPLSLWGLALKCNMLTLGFAGARPYSPLSVKRAFISRGYIQHAFETFHYVPPFENERYIQNTLFLNEMGKMMSLFPSGFYLLIMQKYQCVSPKLLSRARSDTIWLPSA